MKTRPAGQGCGCDMCRGNRLGRSLRNVIRQLAQVDRRRDDPQNHKAELMHKQLEVGDLPPPDSNPTKEACNYFLEESLQFPVRHNSGQICPAREPFSGGSRGVPAGGPSRKLPIVHWANPPRTRARAGNPTRRTARAATALPLNVECAQQAQLKTRDQVNLRSSTSSLARRPRNPIEPHLRSPATPCLAIAWHSRMRATRP
jgi:hypothetical protein